MRDVKAKTSSSKKVDPKIKRAVTRAREVRQKAADLSPEENERHFNLAMEMIYGEAAAASPRR